MPLPLLIQDRKPKPKAGQKAPKARKTEKPENARTVPTIAWVLLSFSLFPVQHPGADPGTLKFKIISKRLRQSHRAPNGRWHKFHATSYREICTSEYNFWHHHIM